MLENTSEFIAVSGDDSSGSVSDTSINGDDPQMSVNKEHSKFLESVYESILVELIDDAVLDVCFDVHRSARLDNGFPLENSEKNFKNQIDDQPKTTITCPICRQMKGVQKFTTHLSDCMGYSSTRKARQKESIIENSDSDLDDDNEYEEFIPGTSKRRNKKGTKTVRKQSKVSGNSIAKQYLNYNSNYLDMSNEQKNAFFKVNCGVISKRTRRPCTKTINCSQHTSEQRRDIRNCHLSNNSEQITAEEEIDVDTVDEDISPQFAIPS